MLIAHIEKYSIDERYPDVVYVRNDGDTFHARATGIVSVGHSHVGNLYHVFVQPDVGFWVDKVEDCRPLVAAQEVAEAIDGLQKAQA